MQVIEELRLKIAGLLTNLEGVEMEKLEAPHYEALQICLNCLEEYPEDYYFNIWAGHNAKSLYMPILAIQVLPELHDPLNNDVVLFWHYLKVRKYFGIPDDVEKI